MAVLFSDLFTGALFDDIDEAPARSNLWTYRSSYTGESVRWYLANGMVHPGVAGVATADVAPPSADYAVECSMILYTNQPNQRAGPCIRHDGGDQYYTAYYQDGQLVLAKKVLGVTTVLDTWVSALTYGGTAYTVRLEAVGTAIGAYLNGVLRVNATDPDITWTGLAGLRATSWGDVGVGVHFDNFKILDDTILVTERNTVILSGL